MVSSVTESGRPPAVLQRPQASRLEIRRQFFSQRVAESRNKTPASVKLARNVKTVSKIAAELSVTQWWKTANLSGPTRGHGDSTFK